MSLAKKIYSYWFRKIKQDEVRLESTQKVCIIRDDSIGDLITTLPFLFSLKKAYPAIEWTMLVSSRNVALMKLFPNINYIEVPLNLSNGRLFFKLWQYRGHFDLVIDLFERRISRSAFIYAALNPEHVIGVKRRAKYGLKDEDFQRIEHAWQLDYSMPFFENYRHYINSIIKQNISKIDYLESVPWNLPKLASERAKKYCEKLIRPIVLLNVQGSDDYRTLKAQSVEILAKEIVKTQGCNIIITAMPNYVKELRHDMAEIENVTYIYNDTTVVDMIALCKEVDVVVSVDTSLVHIASVLNKPIVGIYIQERLDNYFFAPYSDKQSMVLSTYMDKLDDEQSKNLGSKICTSLELMNLESK